jgi:hypothetical protein
VYAWFGFLKTTKFEVVLKRFLGFINADKRDYNVTFDALDGLLKDDRAGSLINWGLLLKKEIYSLVLLILSWIFSEI